MPVVLVPPARWERWLENFTRSHGATELSVEDGRLDGAAADGSTFSAHLPFSLSYDGPAVAFAAAAVPPADWGVLLVRKGGFAVARLRGTTVEASKVGQRHVQGRSKAGGQSQQRFARRRANQARDAYEAAADHAARVLGDTPVLVVGGDRGAVAEVLEDRRLAAATVVGGLLAVPDPRRSVLDQAVLDASAITVDVVNAPAQDAPGITR